MGAPLEGIKAIEWGEGANGPLIGVILGDFGADVIKVEQRGVGDPHRGMGAAPAVLLPVESDSRDWLALLMPPSKTLTAVREVSASI